ncbi:MAG: carboxypeptidase regulatory-like domain-containing protein [Bacteroidales bacterium]|nr:carboxypeptidase regulatory-like domain-containing protein [Bacteroidales bacterium]
MQKKTKRKKNIITLVVLTLTLMTLGASCQKKQETGTLYGIITDKVTGEPVKGVNVELLSTDHKTQTGADGWYKFTEVNIGEYELQVTKQGYSFVKSQVSVQNNSVRSDAQIEFVPTFQYNGHTYMVAPDAGGAMILTYAHYSYCQELTVYGYSDWRLPTKDELQQMYIDKDKIGGFLDKVYWSSTYSRRASSGDLYYCILFSTGDVLEGLPSSFLHVRPIRIEN